MMVSFANNVHTPEGGMHEEGFKRALTNVLNSYGRKIGVLKNCFDDPRAIAEMVAERTHSQVVQVIGKKIVLYKPDKDKPKIELPR